MPVASPPMVWLVAVASVTSWLDGSSQFGTLDACHCTVYPVTAAPPSSDGAVHTTPMLVIPTDSASELGAPGE